MRKIALALLISIFAFFLRTYAAYYGPIEADEQTYATAAVKYNIALRESNWDQIINTNFHNEHPQFYKFVYAIGLMASKPGLEPATINTNYLIQTVQNWHKFLILRMISVVFGSAIVFLMSMINPIAGLFFAINTYAIKYTSVVYLEALPLFAVLISFLTAIKTFDTYYKNSTTSKAWIGWLILSSVTMGMVVASKYIYGIVAIPMMITILIKGWKNKVSTLIGLIGWGLLALGFFILFDPVLWHSPLTELSNSIGFSINYSGGQHVKEVGYPFWQPIKWLLISIPQYPNVPWAFAVDKGEYFFSADTFLFALAVLGIPRMAKKNLPMFLWFLIGMLFLFVWNTKWPQYILLVLVPFCFSASNGVNFISTEISKLKRLSHN